MPYQIWLAMLTFAGLCTMYSLFVKDKNNYTDAIAGIISVIFWVVSGLSILGGIQTEFVTYRNAALMWVFVAIGVIMAIITIVRILDIMTERKSGHVRMGFNRL